jgi:hypothetical protein
LYVYPGWFNGNLNDAVNVLRTLAVTLGVDVFEEFVSVLTIVAVLFALGYFLALMGAFIKGSTGRGFIVIGAVLSLFGICAFSYIWSRPFSLSKIPVSFSFSEVSPLFSASWGWSYGFYIAIISFLVLLASVVFHPAKAEVKEETKISAGVLKKQPLEQKQLSVSPRKRSYLESVWEARAKELVAGSSPLLCRLGLHRWQYYGENVFVATRKYIKTQDKEMPATTGMKLANTKRECLRCHIKQMANVFTNEDGTLSVRGWSDITNEN